MALVVQVVNNNMRIENPHYTHKKSVKYIAWEPNGVDGDDMTGADVWYDMAWHGDGTWRAWGHSNAVTLVSNSFSPSSKFAVATTSSSIFPDLALRFLSSNRRSSPGFLLVLFSWKYWESCRLFCKQSNIFTGVSGIDCAEGERRKRCNEDTGDYGLLELWGFSPSKHREPDV